MTRPDRADPYAAEALGALSTEALEALATQVRAVLHERTVAAILAHHRAPAMDRRP